MITTVVTSYLRRRVKDVSFWASARFSFSAQGNLLHVPKSFRRKFLAALNFLAHTIHATFVLIRLIQYRYFDKDNELDERSKIFMESYCLFILVCPLCAHLCFFLREEAFANFINQYLTYYRSIEGLAVTLPYQ